MFFTGFPGFLGMELLPRVLRRRPEDRALCLVQPKFAELARQRVAELARAHPDTEGRVIMVEGDITKPGLGVEPGTEREVAEIFHLAAVYDLAVPRQLGFAVNVGGTRNVLDFAERCPALSRFQYVSTCYVSGRHAGPYAEEDLDKGQVFNNFYEETKYLAEADVRARMRGGLPATIYRPAITVGDAATGVTQKYDGPYYVIQWLLRQPGPLGLMPTVGDLRTEVNVVPRDFVVGAIAQLSGLEASRGKTYQLADPAPLRAKEMLETVAEAVGKRLVKIPLRLDLAKFAIDRVPGVYPLMRIPAPAIDYFVHPTHYETRNTMADLRGSGISCPPFPAYVGKLVSFVREHPEVGAAAMV
ncbi:MAG: SDR family oxidoreductase [Anaeromyxobacter sp.]